MASNENSDQAVYLATLFARNEDLLLEELGRGLLGIGPSFGPGDGDRFRRLAKEWLATHTDQLRQQICSKPAAQALMNGEMADKLADVAIIADAISAILGRPSASIVAVILARRGLGAFCSGGGPVTFG